MNKLLNAPWYAVQRKTGYPEYDGGPIVRLWDVYDDNGCVVSMGTIYGDSKLNAALIAAAPEMYEALKELVDQCALSTPLWDKASAILAKVDK